MEKHQWNTITCGVCHEEQATNNRAKPMGGAYRVFSDGIEFVCEDCLEKEHKQYVCDIEHFENKEISSLLELLKIFKELGGERSETLGRARN